MMSSDENEKSEFENIGIRLIELMKTGCDDIRNELEKVNNPLVLHNLFLIISTRCKTENDSDAERLREIIHEVINYESDDEHYYGENGVFFRYEEQNF